MYVVKGDFMQTDPRFTKTCTKCLYLRPIGEFDKKKAHGCWCRACYLKYFKQYNQKRYASSEAKSIEQERGRQKYIKNVKPQRMERKKNLLQMMGGKCSVCGYSRSAAALDFDHLDLDGKTAVTARNHPNKAKCRTISHLLAMNNPKAFSEAIEEAKKCRILCANCHREMTFPGHELST